MKKISLTQGKVTLVDDIDYEYLNQWKWYAAKDGNTFYAIRTIKRNGKQTTIHMYQVLAKRLDFQDSADHKNRNGLDNQRSNLRNATQKQQRENQGIPKNNTSGHKGICWDKQRSKWRAQIGHNGKCIYLGLFDNIEDTVKARKEAEEKYFTHSN